VWNIKYVIVINIKCFENGGQNSNYVIVILTVAFPLVQLFVLEVLIMSIKLSVPFKFLNHMTD
jgi:hypothetical protein